MLASYFLLPGSEKNPRDIFAYGLIKTLMEWVDPTTSKGFYNTVFGSFKKQPAVAIDVKIVLLKLFAVGILVPSVKEASIDCAIAYNEHGDPLFRLDATWERIPHKN